MESCLVALNGESVFIGFTGFTGVSVFLSGPC